MMWFLDAIYHGVVLILIASAFASGIYLIKHHRK